jgi:signal transduction histidine kinase/DNA-binding response OmpR family regulator
MTGQDSAAIAIAPTDGAPVAADALQRAIFSSANFSSITTDTQGVIQIFTVGAQRRLGYAAHELVNQRHLSELTDPLELAIRAQALSLAYATPVAAGFEALVFKALRGEEFLDDLTFICQDGSRLSALVSVTALRDEGERVIGFLLITTDNTARKLAQVVLEHNQQHLMAQSAQLVRMDAEQQRLNRCLLLLSEFSLVLLQAETEVELLDDMCRLIVETGNYLMCWVGFAQHDADKSILPVAHFGHSGEFMQRMKFSWDAALPWGRGPSGTAIRSGKAQVNQNCLTNPLLAPWQEAARVQGFQSNAALPIHIDQQVVGVLSFFSAEAQAFSAPEVSLLEKLAADMAFALRSLRARRELDRHQHKLEELVSERTYEIEALNVALRSQAEQADQANQAKSSFLSSMSHELRTPLNAVVGLSALLDDSPLNRRQRDYADKIQLSAQALRALVDDILDFSKIEAGELTLEHSPFSLDTILRTTAATLGVALAHKPIEAYFDIAPELSDALLGDALRFQQIMLNLTSNAAKFTERGEIEVSINSLILDAHRVMLQLTVRDTGIGIAPDQLETIFDAFTQAENSTSRLYGGTGLGLSISARLATLMGGKISVKSTVGEGSEFCFTVTLARGTNDAAPALPEVPANLHVLIIDDHAAVRAVLSRTCVSLGWTVTLCASGAAGLLALQRSATQGQPFDLMLLDWQMPELDGLDMLRQANAVHLGVQLPRVILMAPIFMLEQAVAASHDLSLDAILVKPMTPSNLLEAVVRAANSDLPQTPKLKKVTEKRLAGMRLLVAEDNDINQEVIEQIFVRAGAEVVLVGNGQEAVAALQVPGAQFDAVLMDIRMPVMDGYTATRMIRAELGLLNLPIIAVTAFASPQDREKSRQAGMSGHIVKPINVDDLLEILTRVRAVAP